MIDRINVCMAKYCRKYGRGRHKYDICYNPFDNIYAITLFESSSDMKKQFKIPRFYTSSMIEDCIEKEVTSFFMDVITNETVSRNKPFQDFLIDLGWRCPLVDKVIFNPPATIVLWKDGTKTVVKCKDGDTYDRWTGLAMCHMKKMYGTGFHKKFRDWCGELKEEKDLFNSISNLINTLVEKRHVDDD